MSTQRRAHQLLFILKIGFLVWLPLADDVHGADYPIEVGLSARDDVAILPTVSQEPALEPCELLEWDSRHFGLRIGRVRRGPPAPPAAAVVAWRARERMDCLYALVPLENLCEMQGLQDAGFRFVDVRVTLARDPSPADATGRSPHVRPATPNDVPALRRLAGELHRDSRFFADARFPPDRSRLLFEIWIEQLCAGRAGQVFVADVDGAPVGYVACEQTEPDVTRIQLIGVSPAAQRHGVGSGLLAAALSAGAERHPSPRVEVVTQGRNLGALRFYQRHGFLTTAQAVWYHWWA